MIKKMKKNNKREKIQKDGQQPKGPTTPDPKGRVKTELPMTGISFFGFGGRPVKKKEKKRNKDRQRERGNKAKKSKQVRRVGHRTNSLPPDGRSRFHLNGAFRILDTMLW